MKVLRVARNLLWLAYSKLRVRLIWFAYVGEGTVVHFPINVRHPSHIRFGERCVIGEYAFLVASPKAHISIGDDVIIAPNVHINVTSHNYDKVDVPIQYQGSTERSVTVEDDVWIGTGVVVLQGVRIGRGAIVGAGAVVKEDVGDWDIVAGVPAKVIGERGVA